MGINKTFVVESISPENSRFYSIKICCSYSLLQSGKNKVKNCKCYYLFVFYGISNSFSINMLIITKQRFIEVLESFEILE